MDSPQGTQPSPEPLAKLAPALQWVLILIVSVAFIFLIEAARMPAAGLLGPMIAGVLAGTNGATVRVPSAAFAMAQGVLGVMIAGSIQLGVLHALAEDWPLFLAGTISTVMASSFLGWQISRWKILPGSTAIWGSAPGAATAMVLMAGAFGADFRLVAFMQYLRVVMVAALAAIIAAVFMPGGATVLEKASFFPQLDWPVFSVTLAIVVAGCAFGRLMRVPSPYFMGVLILAVILHLGFGTAFQLPPWLLLAAYAMVGWTIGLNFTRAIVRHAVRVLPQIAGSILLLLGFCAAIGFVLSRLMGVDLLTAYLATSPGGMDSIAIIAAASGEVNMSFILAMQMARFLFVLSFGPTIARLLARTAPD